MARIIVALALGGAAAFAPAAVPRASTVRFMDEEELKGKIMNAGPAEFNKIEGVCLAGEIPDDIKFEVPIPAKVMGRWDGECAITVSPEEMVAGLEKTASVQVVPDSMGYEDYYAGWAPESTPGVFAVSPDQGRMERRGGTPTDLEVEIKPDGQTGEKVGYLCVVLPDDDEQFTIKVTVKAF